MGMERDESNIRIYYKAGRVLSRTAVGWKVGFKAAQVDLTQRGR
jgi:hypothetical protein